MALNKNLDKIPLRHSILWYVHCVDLITWAICPFIYINIIFDTFENCYQVTSCIDYQTTGRYPTLCIKYICVFGHTLAFHLFAWHDVKKRKYYFKGIEVFYLNAVQIAFIVKLKYYKLEEEYNAHVQWIA